MDTPQPLAAPAGNSVVAARLKLVGISKRYSGVQANQRVSLEVAPGEIHGVLGENGAGKSTLMKIIYGAVHPDEGEMFWDGRRVRVTSPSAARALGIAMVFQHFALFDSLTVAENVWLGVDAAMSRNEVERRILEVAQTYELDPEPKRLLDRRVNELSVGERQRVEILRALLGDPRLLILDEPTSVLTPQAAQKLLTTLRRLAAGGCSILYISHKLDEIRDLCDRCTILRGGRVTGVVTAARETNQSLSELMLGAEAPPRARAAENPRRPSSNAVDNPSATTVPTTLLPAPVKGAAPASGTATASALAVRGLSLAPREPFGKTLSGIDFSVEAGEILGIAGISGSGQRELLDVLSGEDTRAAPGTILLWGQDVSARAVRARRALGLGYVPEERIGRATVPGLSLAANTILTRRDTVAPSGFLRWAGARRLAARLIERFGVRARGPESAARSLSGGNLQKFIVGREIDAGPKVLVVEQPTWGLDVGAASRIRAELLLLAQDGVALLVVSEDLEELREICASIVVISAGRLSPRVKVAEVSVTQIGEWMSGLFPDAAASPGSGVVSTSTSTRGGVEPSPATPAVEKEARANLHV